MWGEGALLLVSGGFELWLGCPGSAWRPCPGVGVALGGRGLWAHSDLRVKGQRGWVNLRTFPPPGTRSLTLLGSFGVCRFGGGRQDLEVLLEGQCWGSSHGLMYVERLRLILSLLTTYCTSHNAPSPPGPPTAPLGGGAGGLHHRPSWGALWCWC